MKKALSYFAVVGVLVILGASLLACGGSGGGSAGAPASGSSSARDISTPATALLGHWSDGNGTDEYFSSTMWYTTMPGAGSRTYKYVVKSQDAATRTIVLTTTSVEASGQGEPDASATNIKFLDAGYAKMSYGFDLRYVDAQQSPPSP